LLEQGISCEDASPSKCGEVLNLHSAGPGRAGPKLSEMAPTYSSLQIGVCQLTDNHDTQ